MGLFVPLDVDYQMDAKVIDAGIYGELLYVRALAFAKRTMSDGKIRTAQLGPLALGIPKPPQVAARLVEVGLWLVHAEGWLIAAWSKRNQSAEAITAKSDRKRLAAQKANHERWHVGEEGKPSDSCPLCSEVGSDSDASRIRARTRSESTETETETEEESYPESETIPSDDNTTSDRPDEETIKRAKEVAVRFAEIAWAGCNQTAMRYPSNFKNERYRFALAHTDLLRLLRNYPTAPPDVIASALKGENHSLRYYRVEVDA